MGLMFVACENGHNNNLPNNPNNSKCFEGTMTVDQNDGTFYTQDLEGGYLLYNMPCSKEDYDKIVKLHDSPANTVCLCTGSLGSNPDNDVPAAIRLSRATLRNIRENLFWAFCYNTLGIPLAAGLFISLWGWELNPMFGAAAMSLSSFCVVTNALRLKFFKPAAAAAPIEVDDITALTGEQLDALEIGAKVAKKTGTAKHLYVVSYKDAENGGL